MFLESTKGATLVNSDFLPTEFSEAFRAHLAATLDDDEVITNTLLWEHWARTDGDIETPSHHVDMGRALFYSYPWQEGRAPVPTKKVGRAPRVLVARGRTPNEGTAYRMVDIIARAEANQRRLGAKTDSGKSLTNRESFTLGDAAYLPLLAQSCIDHNLPKARFSNVSMIMDFWPAFFGHKDFLDVDPSEWDVPHLIVTDGTMRNDCGLGNETIHPLETLQRIGTLTGIPVATPWGVNQTDL